MANPYVENVAFIKNQIVLAIRVDEYPENEVLEISGYATQSNGALAVFNDIKAVPKPNPDGSDYMYVEAAPSQGFKKGQAVTVVLRAARVWTTVLEESGETGVTSLGEDTPAGEGTSWNNIKEVTYALPSSTGSADQTPPGSGANFQGGA